MFNRRERFFSEASARGTSMTSAIWLPSPSRKRALKDPAGGWLMIVTSCWIWERSRISRLTRFEGGGMTVAIVVYAGD